MTRFSGSRFPQPSCLFPDEKELALVLLGRDRSHLWPAIAKAEEKAGLPKVSTQYGGRYWPAVLDFYRRRYKLLEDASTADDERAKENWGNSKKSGRKEG